MLAISSWENQAIGAKMLSLKKLKKFKKDCNNNKKKTEYKNKYPNNKSTKKMMLV